MPTPPTLADLSRGLALIALALAPAAAVASPREDAGPWLLAQAGGAEGGEAFPGSLATLPGDETLEIEFDHDLTREDIARRQLAPAPAAPGMPEGLPLLGESLLVDPGLTKGAGDWQVDFGFGDAPREPGAAPDRPAPADMTRED
ncbi:MAG: hypothetical protein ACU0DT_01975 [Albimonas sp.]|uniref:hypothetical protein n=1 Tax=Albimonas sp. TaxID=1872425 RepID=UPI004057A22E